MIRAFNSAVVAVVTIAVGGSTGASVLAPSTGQPQPLAAAGATPERTMRAREPGGSRLPLAATRHLRFDTSSGTWLSLDLSPDGKTIVFDMLGDIYAMSANGGRARALTTGLPFDTQPTISRDGRWIAFVSDRSGAENLWIMRPGGGGALQVSHGVDDTVLVSPAWAADDQGLYVSRYRADLDQYELWRYGLDGSETLVVPIRDMPVAPRGTWRSSLGVVASPDGRSIYFARRIGSVGLEGIDEWTIVRRDIASGDETVIVGEPEGPRKALNPGAAFRPMLSPDGNLLAYAHRVGSATELRLRDLTTGFDHRLAASITPDQLQASMWQDIVPRYAFSPDGKAVVLAQDGSFERLDVADGKSTRLAFTAAVDLALGPSTKQVIHEDDGPVRARLIMAPVASPDGRSLAFSALGRLWVMRLDGKSLPLPFAAAGDPAFQPSWSPDGKRLTWVTWSERDGGAVWVAPADGSTMPRRVSDAVAYYSYPVFSPDGNSIVTVRSGQAARLRLYMEYGKLRDGELVAFSLAGGAPRTLTRGTIGSRPQFTGDPRTVYILAEDGLVAVDIATGKRRPSAMVKGPGWYFQDGAVAVDDLRISPDGAWLLAQVAQQLYLVPTPPVGSAVLDLTAPAVSARRISAGGADYFEWGDDGQSVTWSTGSTFHRRKLADILRGAAVPIEEFHARIEVPRDRPAGSLLLSGARVFTMADGDRVLPDADVLISGGRIAAVGPRGSLSVPPGTAVRDLRGKTIIPGLIDTHDHIAEVRRDVLGLDDWGLQARLASGVTTSFDPSTLTIDMLAYQDLLDAGLMVGPRIRQTGIALFSMQRFTSLDEVRAVLRRYRDDYGLSNIKEYRTGSRKVREWVAIAARELGLQPTTEGALSMKLDLSQILDGFADNEHALVAAPLGDDVLRLMSETRTGYTATLQITNGGPPGQDWFLDTEDARSNPLLRHYWPRVALDQMTLARPWRRYDQYRFPAIAADAAKIQRRGGLVGIGSHGEMPGIGFHWEMEAHVMGGMTPLEALHAGTIGSAEHIGRASDLGSIVPGKLADLVILDRDPAVDLRAARNPVAVMRDGHLYDAASLDELWPTPRTRLPAWFTTDEQTRSYLPQGESR